MTNLKLDMKDGYVTQIYIFLGFGLKSHVPRDQTIEGNVLEGRGWIIHILRTFLDCEKALY